MSATAHAPGVGTDRTGDAVGAGPGRVGPTTGSPRARAPHDCTVLLLVVGLHLVAETALTPFLPQLFRTLFDVQDLAAAGTFLWVCRVAGCVAFPLWGLAARRWPAERLVLTGLCASTMLYAAMVLSPDYATFIALSAAVVATNAALLLAYPSLISSYERGHRDDEAGGEGSQSRRRLRGIRAYVAVVHGVVVVSTLIGAAVMALPSQRWGLVVFVLLGATLAVLCRRALRSLGPAGSHGHAVSPAAAEAPPGPELPGAATARAQSRSHVGIRPRHLVAVAALAVVFESRPTSFARSSPSTPRPAGLVRQRARRRSCSRACPRWRCSRWRSRPAGCSAGGCCRSPSCSRLPGSFGSPSDRTCSRSPRAGSCSASASGSDRSRSTCGFSARPARPRRRTPQSRPRGSEGCSSALCWPPSPPPRTSSCPWC